MRPFTWHWLRGCKWDIEPTKNEFKPKSKNIDIIGKLTPLQIINIGRELDAAEWITSYAEDALSVEIKVEWLGGQIRIHATPPGSRPIIGIVEDQTPIIVSLDRFIFMYSQQYAANGVP